MEKRIRYHQNIYWFVCILFAIVFLLLIGEGGPAFEDDSNTFLNPIQVVRKSYFLYTGLLSICKYIFGDKIYLWVVWILQSIFAFAASFMFAEYIRKYFGLNFIEAFIVYVSSFLPYTYSLPEVVANHYILTESLAFPLFTVYMLFVFKVFLENKKKWMLPVGIFTIMIVLSRSQLLLLVPVYVLLWLIIALQKIYMQISKERKRVFWTGLVVGIGGVCIVAVFTVTALIGNKSIIQLSQLTSAISGRVLCVIDEEDRNLFVGDEQRAYDLVFQRVDENKSRYPYFREGVWKWEDIANATNRNINIYVPAIDEYYQSMETEPEQGLRENTANNIISKLFTRHLGDYLHMTMHLLAQSFVVAIFFHPSSIISLCYIVALMIYVVAIVLLWYSGKNGVSVKYRIPLAVTMLVLASIVIITNIIFYGLQRYVVYTFGCFYVSMFILLIGIYRTKKNGYK